MVLRSFEHYKNCCETLELMPLNQRKHDSAVKGVKGMTIMASCIQFDPMVQVPPDSMHNVFLGVTKLFIKIWFDSKYSDSVFYIPPIHRIEIDKRLSKMQTYSECGRLPRKITEYKQWKANEFYNWLFLYSKFVLSDGILNPEHYRHFLRFSESMEILHSNCVQKNQLNQTEQNLKTFVQDFQKLYGRDCMVYNIHLLLHLVDAVRKFGPLHNYSLFVYENFNGVLGNFLRGPNGPLIQLATRNFSYFNISYGKVKNMNIEALKFCQEVVKKSSTFYKRTNERKKFELFEFDGKKYKSYKKYYSYCSTISTFNKDNRTKYIDCFIYYKNVFYQISKILLDDNSFLYILGCPVITMQFHGIPNYHQILTVQEPVIQKIEDKFSKCFFYAIDDKINALSIVKNPLIID